MRNVVFWASLAGLAALLCSSTYTAIRSYTYRLQIPYKPLISPDVFVRTGEYQNCGHGDTTPTSTFLINHGSDWILIDAGSPGRKNSRDLLAAVNKAIGAGRLRLLLLTHGHNDHVGALPALMRAHPTMQVVFHADEAPYLRGAAPSSCSQCN